MKKIDILTLGELLIDMFPEKIGPRIGEVEAFIPKPGGAPANVAVAAKRLGAVSAFIGKVGDDLFGIYLKKILDFTIVSLLLLLLVYYDTDLRVEQLPSRGLGKKFNSS